MYTTAGWVHLLQPYEMKIICMVVRGGEWREFAYLVCENPVNNNISELECGTALQNLNEVLLPVLTGEEFTEFWKIKNHGGKYIKLVDVISDIDTLVAAYENIKLKSGYLISVFNDEMLDSILRQRQL